MQLDTNNHSVFMLHYHLIMCIKYRNKVIDDNISNRLKEIFEKIAPAYNITLEEWNHDTDHVHILFKGQPNTEISKFINAYKSASSRLIKKEFPVTTDVVAGNGAPEMKVDDNIRVVFNTPLARNPPFL